MSEKETNRVHYFLVEFIKTFLSVCLYVVLLGWLIMPCFLHSIYVGRCAGLPSCQDFSSNNQDLGKPAGWASTQHNKNSMKK